MNLLSNQDDKSRGLGFSGLVKGNNEGTSEEDEVAIEESQKPTLQGAIFEAGDVKRLEDYLHLGENEGLRSKNIFSGKSWKIMVALTFQVTCLGKRWKVYKRRNEFKKLNKALKADLSKDHTPYEDTMPLFKDDANETPESMRESLDALVAWLQKLAEMPEVRDNQHFLEFCEVSSCTYKFKGCIRYKEGPLEKRSGGRFKQQSGKVKAVTAKCWRRWAHRWLVLTDKYLAILTDSNDEEPDEIMLIDSDFHVVYGEEKTGDDLGIHVINRHRKLELKASDAFEWTTWLRALKTAIDNNGLQARVMREHNSFAPERPNNHVKIYADGHDYYYDLYDQLNSAKSQVFITDWWMTPELYLRRPVNMEDGNMEQYRLDNVLWKLAERGVKIYILVWKEVEIAGLYNLSSHVKEVLQGKHKNIIVFRHPTTLISFWSHHEKI